MLQYAHDSGIGMYLHYSCGLFYGIGALVSAITDKTLKFEMMRNSFRLEG